MLANNLQDIPQLIQLLLYIRDDVIIYQQKINQLMGQLINQIDQIKQPIKTYQDSPSLNELGEFLKQSENTYNDIRMAIQQFVQVDFQEQTQILKQNYYTKEIYCELGQQLYKEHQFQQAIISFDKAIQIDPNYVAAWNNKGLSLKEQNKLQEAITCFEKAISIDKRFILAKYNLQNLQKVKQQIKK